MSLNIVQSVREILIHAFPLSPVPGEFFVEGESCSKGDIQGELSRRISGKIWIDVSITDWAMTGVSPAVSRVYVEPKAFLYYFPSLLLGGVVDLNYVDFAINVLVPINQRFEERGAWWWDFKAAVTHDQRLAILKYIALLRSEIPEILSLDGGMIISRASELWA
jgi:hypothetical protein